MKRLLDLVWIGVMLLGVPLSGCAPLMMTGAAVVAVSAGDRRTAGAQIDDQSLQIRGTQRLKEILPGSEESYGSVHAYNRRVLITGLAPDARARMRAEQLVASLGNPRAVFNELQLGPARADASSARDTLTSARVRAILFEDKQVESASIKIVTEANIVYLMGLVTRSEGEHIAALASRISGVGRVVTLWELISDQELADIQSARARQPAASNPAN